MESSEILDGHREIGGRCLREFPRETEECVVKQEPEELVIDVQEDEDEIEVINVQEDQEEIEFFQKFANCKTNGIAETVLQTAKENPSQG